MTGPMQPSPAPVPDHAGWRTRVDDVTLRAAAAVPASISGRQMAALVRCWADAHAQRGAQTPVFTAAGGL